MRSILSISAAAFALGLSSFAGESSAAVINWQAGPVYSGVNGTDAIQVNGNSLQAVNLGATSGLSVIASGQSLTFTAADKLNAGFFASGSPGTSSANFNTIIDQTDFNGTNATVSNFFSGLIPGITYQVQLFASDSRGCCSTRTQSFSDGLGNNSPVFTQGTFTSTLGTFTADSAIQALGLSASSNNPVLSAFVLREVSPQKTTVTLIDEDIEGNVNGWTGWGGALSSPYLNLLPLAGDIDRPDLSGATAVPDAINLLNNNVPFANDTAAGVKTYASVVHEGHYEFQVQVVNWNNSGFGTPMFDFNGLVPTEVIAPAPASGGDEVWTFLFSVMEGSPLIGQQIQLRFGGSTAPGGENFGIDHILAYYTTPFVPEPASATLSLLAAGMLIGRRRRPTAC